MLTRETVEEWWEWYANMERDLLEIVDEHLAETRDPSIAAFLDKYAPALRIAAATEDDGLVEKAIHDHNHDEPRTLKERATAETYRRLLRERGEEE